MDLCRLELGRVRDELRKGRQAATNLLGLIRQQKHLLSTTNANSSWSIPASSDLVAKIVDSLSNSLSMLGCQDPAGSGPRKSSSLSSGGRGCRKPRNYYKCINKPHCQALKRVQKTDDVPRMYKITHTSYHTCETSSSCTPSSFGDKEECAIQQPDSSMVPGNEQLLGIMQPIASPRNAQWSLDDLDYLLGSVEFNDHQAF